MVDHVDERCGDQDYVYMRVRWNLVGEVRNLHLQTSAGQSIEPVVPGQEIAEVDSEDSSPVTRPGAPVHEQLLRTIASENDPTKQRLARLMDAMSERPGRDNRWSREQQANLLNIKVTQVDSLYTNLSYWTKRFPGSQEPLRLDYDPQRGSWRFIEASVAAVWRQIRGLDSA